MQFLLIARMFGFSKHSTSQKSEDFNHPKRKSIERRATDTRLYMKREHIKSESGLCAMDAKTLKLLLAMEHSDHDKPYQNILNNKLKHTHNHSNECINCHGTQIVNDHICQVSNTFTPKGRYTQIICTTFTPYTKNKEEATVKTKENMTKKKDDNTKILTDDDTPPLPTRATTGDSTGYKLGKSLLNIPTPKLSSYRFADNEQESSDDDDDEDDDDDIDVKNDKKEHNGHSEQNTQNGPKAGDSHEDTTSDGNNVDNHLRDEDNETVEEHANGGSGEELSNLVKSESEKIYWKKSQEKLEREIAIMHYQESDQHAFIQRMFPDLRSMEVVDEDVSSTPASFEPWESDKSSGLILKSLTDADSIKHQRRPSNLFRKKSGGKWKIDDLDDQEASLKRHILQLQHSIGSQKRNGRSIKRKQKNLQNKLKSVPNTPTPSDYTLSSLSHI